MDDLNITSLKLFNSLGETNKKEYLQQLHSWFMGKQTKLEFNSSVRNIMTSDDQIHLHNEFLLAVLNKGYQGTNNISSVKTIPNEKISHHSNKKKRRSSKNISDKANFEPMETTDVLLSNPSNLDRSLTTQRYAAQELFLPDIKMITGRLMICAWSEDLRSADENISEFILQASHIFLKNIISTILTRHRGYKVRKPLFQYGFGIDVPNPWLRNTNYIEDPSSELDVDVGDNECCLIPKVKATLPNMEFKSAFSYACTHNTQLDSRTELITLAHVYNALKYDSSVIGHYGIYATHMEKILMRLRQPITYIC